MYMPNCCPCLQIRISFEHGSLGKIRSRRLQDLDRISNFHQKFPTVSA